MKRAIILGLVFALFSTLPAFAKPKKKTFNNSSEQVFAAALKTARERHVITFVDEKQLLITFQTGLSFWSAGFVCNASVDPEGPGRATLTINVQGKQGGGMSMGAGDRMADKFFQQVEETLAGDVKQSAEIHPEAKPIAVAPPKAVPVEPTVTQPANGPAAPEFGKVGLVATSEVAEIIVDGNFVGNAPAELKLTPGRHTVVVTARGYKPRTRELTVLPGSEVRLNAQLERE